MSYEPNEAVEGVQGLSACLSRNIQLAAAAADPRSYVPLDNDLPDGGHFVKDMIRNETIMRLSKEAKEVIELVLDSPIEIISAYGRPSKDLIKKELRRRGWKHKIIQLVFEEIQLFVKELC